MALYKEKVVQTPTLNKTITELAFQIFCCLLTIAVLMNTFGKFLLTTRATIHLAFLPACQSICLSIVVKTELEIGKLYRAQSLSDGFEIWFQGSQ